MILKYRGYNFNWCFIEAESFTVAQVHLPEAAENEPQTSDEELEQISQCYQRAQETIKTTSGFGGDNIRFLIGDTDLRKLSHCTAVVPAMSAECLVFCKEAYLMTDTGKTIERIS